MTGLHPTLVPEASLYPFSHSRGRRAGLSFLEDLASFAGSAAEVAATSRSGFWERAHQLCTGHARAGPGPRRSRAAVVRGGAASVRLPCWGHIGGFSLHSGPPSALVYCGHRAGFTARDHRRAASSGAKAAAVTPPPGQRCEAGWASPHRARRQEWAARQRQAMALLPVLLSPWGLGL